MEVEEKKQSLALNPVHKNIFFDLPIELQHELAKDWLSFHDLIALDDACMNHALRDIYEHELLVSLSKDRSFSLSFVINRLDILPMIRWAEKRQLSHLIKDIEIDWTFGLPPYIPLKIDYSALNRCCRLQKLYLELDNLSHDNDYLCLKDLNELEILDLEKFSNQMNLSFVKQFSKLKELHLLNNEEYLDVPLLPLSQNTLQTISSFTQLHKLSLNNYPYSSSFSLVSYLSPLTHLIALSLSHTPIYDEDLTLLIETLPNLQELDLTNNQTLSSQGFVLLSHFSQLKKLVLYETSITSEGLLAVASLSSLTYLDLSLSQNIFGSVFQHLQSLTKLQILNLATTNIADEDVLIAVQGSKQSIHKLDLYCSNVIHVLTIDELLSQLPLLTCLDIGYLDSLSSGSIFLTLSRAKQLQELSISVISTLKHQDYLSFLQFLQQTNINKLILCAPSLSFDYMNLLTLELLHIKELHISNGEFIATELYPLLARLQSLETLKLDNAMIDEAGLEAISQLPLLKTFCVSTNVEIPDDSYVYSYFRKGVLYLC